MSRYYKIEINKQDEPDKVWVPDSMTALGSKKYSFASVDDDGNALHSALDVAIDIPVATLSQPRQACMVRVFGVSLNDISQFSHLVGATVKVHGGMLEKGGLPLAKQFKPDLLMHGLIMWSSGNWEAPSNMSLDMFVVPLSATDIKTKTTVDLTFDWQAGKNLKDGIKTMLENAYGKSNNKDGYEIVINISDELVSVQQQAGTPYRNLSSFAKQLQEVTKAQKIKMPDDEVYEGVQMKVWDKKIFVYDNSKPESGTTQNTKAKPLDINFIELIGQPTWKTAAHISFKTIMRADIQVADYIKLPKDLRTPYVLTSGGPAGGAAGGTAPNTPSGIKLPSKDKSAFAGKFQVIEVRHLGQFRQGDGRSWVTAFDAVAIHKEVVNRKTAEEEAVKKETTPAVPFGPPAPGNTSNVPQATQGPLGGGGV